MNLGLPEIFVILLVALIVFGPQRLPEVARQLGAAMRHLRNLQENVKAELDGVLHPDLNPEPTNSSPAFEGDHSQLPAPAVDETPAEGQSDDTNFDDGFSGPSGSFI